MTKNKKLNVNPLFRDFFPPLTEDERQRLKEGIIGAGRVLDPIRVWAETGDVVDGYNRLEIAKEEGVPYDVHELSFPDEAHVLEWMYSHQAGRRNLTERQLRYARGKLVNAVASRQGQRSDLVADDESSSDSELTRTQVIETIAERDSVSESTVRKDARLAASVDQLAAPLREGFINGSLRLPDHEINVLATVPKTQQKKAVNAVRNGDAASVKEFLTSPDPDSREEDDAPPTDAKEQMEQSNREIEAWARKAQELAQELPLSEWLDTQRLSIINDQLRSAANTARQAKGVGVCTRCSGGGCKACRRSGWLPRAEFAAVS